MSGQRYYVRRGNKTIGPLTGEQIGDAIRRRDFRRSDGVATSEGDEFFQLGDVYKDVVAGRWAFGRSSSRETVDRGIRDGRPPNRLPPKIYRDPANRLESLLKPIRSLIDTAKRSAPLIGPLAGILFIVVFSIGASLLAWDVYGDTMCTAVALSFAVAFSLIVVGWVSGIVGTEAKSNGFGQLACLSVFPGFIVWTIVVNLTMSVVNPTQHQRDIELRRAISDGRASESSYTRSEPDTPPPGMSDFQSEYVKAIGAREGLNEAEQEQFRDAVWRFNQAQR